MSDSKLKQPQNDADKALPPIEIEDDLDTVSAGLINTSGVGCKDPVCITGG